MRLDAARRSAHRFFEFCVSDPVRYQLLFQRTIPDFVPSERSYAVAQDVYERTFDRLKAIGLDQPGDRPVDRGAHRSRRAAAVERSER